MPTSSYYQINTIMDLVSRTNPNSVLDIGIGFGKYGVLSREYLEMWDGRKGFYNDWRRRIDGIEGFKDYITPLHNFIYDNIYIGDAKDIIPTLKIKYDLILLIDVLEHFDYKDGLQILENCRKIGKNILISTPKDIGYQDSSFLGNDYETHRFQWEKKHFKCFSDKVFILNQGSLICYIGEKSFTLKEKIKRIERNELKWRIRELFPFLKYPYRIIKRITKHK